MHRLLSIIYLFLLVLSKIYALPYIGAGIAYGSTTWDALVPSLSEQSSALSISMPTNIREGGATYNAYLGYEFNDHFALESNYYTFPKTSVYFDSMSLFAFEHNGDTVLNTRTESINVLGKFMIPFFFDKTRFYSSIGPAIIHRDDMIVNKWRITPAFGVGILKNFNTNWITEIVANFTPGYGESQINPTNTYIPFLYSVTARIAFYIN